MGVPLVEKLEYVALDEATRPRDGEVLTDRWWVVHPYRGLAFYRPDPKRRFRAPQCNHSEAIIDSFCADMYPGHDAIFVPVVYVGPRYHAPEE